MRKEEKRKSKKKRIKNWEVKKRKNENKEKFFW